MIRSIAYCSKRKEWFHGPSSEPTRVRDTISPRISEEYEAHILTEHNIARADEDDVEVVCTSNMANSFMRKIQVYQRTLLC